VTFPAADLEGEVVRRGGEGEWVVRFPAGTAIEERLEKHGDVPLPPYIRRRPDEADRSRYQTVFAGESGSVAAPTAGLHFTESMLAAARDRGVGVARVTLHVGPGTFRPIRSDRIEDHEMEKEHYVVPAETAEAIRSCRTTGGRLIAIGTTAVRTLESAAAADGSVHPGSGWTDLFLYPPAEPRVVDGILTNFHLPRSTLFLLVCTFAGRETMLAAYTAAVEAGYRFYSYGDCMLII